MRFMYHLAALAVLAICLDAGMTVLALELGVAQEGNRLTPGAGQVLFAAGLLVALAAALLRLGEHPTLAPLALGAFTTVLGTRLGIVAWNVRVLSGAL